MPPFREPKTAKTPSRAHRRTVQQLVEAGGALAEIVAYVLNTRRDVDMVVLRQHLTNWDAAALAVPESWLE